MFQEERGGPGSPLRGTSSRRGVSVWKVPAWGEDMWSLYGDGTCSLLYWLPWGDEVGASDLARMWGWCVLMVLEVAAVEAEVVRPVAEAGGRPGG